LHAHTRLSVYSRSLDSCAFLLGCMMHLFPFSYRRSRVVQHVRDSVDVSDPRACPSAAFGPPTASASGSFSFSTHTQPRRCGPGHVAYHFETVPTLSLSFSLRFLSWCTFVLRTVHIFPAVAPPVLPLVFIPAPRMHARSRPDVAYPLVDTPAYAQPSLRTARSNTLTHLFISP
jgi:hypothetical protein